MQTILIVDDDVHVAHALAEGIVEHGRKVIVCGDAAMAEMVVERERPEIVLSDIRLTGPFRYEGLDFIDFVRARNPGCSMVMMSADMTSEIRTEALRRGAIAAFPKPFDLGSLSPFLKLEPLEDEGPVITVPALEQILAGNPPIRPNFQPIVHLGDESVFGFESLLRIQTDSLFARPDLLFQYASKLRRVTDLELAALRSTLRVAGGLVEHGYCFANLHPLALVDGERLCRELLAAIRQTNFPAERLVLELTEQDAIANQASVTNAIDDLKREGIRFAFDDVGTAHSHLSRMDLIGPSFLKVSQHFGTDFEKDATRKKVVRNLLGLARDFGAELILEGIESAETAVAAKEMGITLGQGYHFARPAAAELVLERLSRSH